MPLHIVHHTDYDAGLPADHRFPMSKYTALMRALDARGLRIPRFEHSPVPALPSWLRLVHDGTYVDQVLHCRVPKTIEREIGFPINERISRRAQLATAGTLLAARLALDVGIACNAAGGSHHARRAQGAGFCTFNDVAVASAVLLAEGASSRILVVDLDVHQGDGTADIFRDEPRVFTFSMHAEKNFPVRKIASTLDASLADGLEDEAYLQTLGTHLPAILGSFQPDLVFYNAGVDPHRDDRLGRLSLSDDGLRRRDRFVVEAVRNVGVPLCGVIGGGYSRDVSLLADRHAILFEEATRIAG